MFWLLTLIAYYHQVQDNTNNKQKIMLPKINPAAAWLWLVIFASRIWLIRSLLTRASFPAGEMWGEQADIYEFHRQIVHEPTRGVDKRRSKSKGAEKLHCDIGSRFTKNKHLQHFLNTRKNLLAPHCAVFANLFDKLRHDS